MKTYVLARLGFMVLMLFGLLVITFAISHVAPGDPARLAAGPDATASMVETVRQKYGLDQPLPVQFGLWLWKAVHGDLGSSIATGRPVLSEVLRAVANTVTLAVVAAAIGFSLGLFFGLVAG